MTAGHSPARTVHLAVATALTLVTAAGAATVSAAQTTTPAHCAGPSAGGDWRSYGGDLANSRNQPAERTIGPAQAAALAPVWKVGVVPSSLASGTDGTPPAPALNGTPVVADGCVFAGGSDGRVVAVNADTGEVVWRTPALGDPAKAGVGGLVVGSVAVADGMVLVSVNEAGDPHAVALGEDSGRQLWRSAAVSTYPGSYTNASPQVFRGVLFFGFSVPEGDPQAQGGFALLRVGDGATLAVTYTNDAADRARGYSGGGLWATPAIDTATGFAYEGAGNPFSKRMEGRNTNAILKVDLNAGPTFGRIVDAYKGNVDQYEASALTQTPACAASEGTPLDEFPLDDPACGQLDLDFGASPNLFTDSHGHRLVGELQKSGYYHAAYADTMEAAWRTPVGGPCAVCNGDSTAVSGGAVLAVGTPGGVLASLDSGSGVPRWAAPVADGVHYGSVSTADGVVYTLDSTGCLDAYDARTGVPLLHRSVTADTGQQAGGMGSSGVAIARHTVYVAAGGDLVAYRPAAG